MEIPIERSTLERQVDGLEETVATLAQAITDLHTELHAAYGRLRFVLLTHNTVLQHHTLALRDSAHGAEIESLESLFNLPAHEEGPHD